MKHVSCIVPTGHLSYAPLEPGSFNLGLKEHPGAIIARAGSCVLVRTPGDQGSRQPDSTPGCSTSTLPQGAAEP